MTGDAASISLVNGREIDLLSVYDRGLLYGDGLFETIAVRKAQPCFWDRHMARLTAGAGRLGITSPETGLLLAEVRRLLKNRDQAVLKIIITRGAGGRGYQASESLQPTRIVQVFPWRDYPERYATDGIRARICNLRLGNNPALAGIKHLNRLEQVLARQEWNDPGIMEGLMMDAGGYLVEGTMSNLFLVRDRTLITPDLSGCGVAGIMRGIILDLASQRNIASSIRMCSLDDLKEADEVFITNSLIGIWPVRQIEDWQYQPNNLSKKLLDMVYNATDHDFEEHAG